MIDAAPAPQRAPAVKTTAEFERRVQQWLSSHRDADEIVLDAVTGLPVRAVYYNPLPGWPRVFVFGGEDDHER